MLKYGLVKSTGPKTTSKDVLLKQQIYEVGLKLLPGTESSRMRSSSSIASGIRRVGVSRLVS